MRRALLIAKRDYVAAVKTKTFLVGLVMAPLLFGGGFLGVALMRAKPDLRERRVAVVDHSGRVAGFVVQAAEEKNAKGMTDKKTGRQTEPRYAFEKSDPASGAEDLPLKLSDLVRSRELDAFVEIEADVLVPGGGEAKVKYYANASGIDQMRNWVSGAVNDGVRMARMAAAGVEPARMKDLLAGVPMQSMSLVARDEKSGEIREARKKNEMEGFLVPYSLVLLLSMMVMMGASPMMAAVTHDKTKRVVEMLIGVATPMELMAGKVMAAVAVSVTSSAFYVVGGAFVLQGLGMAGMLSPALFVWFFVYLLADLTMLCAIAAAMGALASTPQEAQQTAILVLAPVMIPLFLIVSILGQPNSMSSTVLSLFPLFTPVLMLARQAMPVGVPAWQPWVGLAGVLITVPAIVWLAARIFRLGILLQGKAPKAADVLKWAIRG